MESEGLSSEAADSELGDEAAGPVTSTPPAGEVPHDPLPVEEILRDHPLFGTDVDGLLTSDREWVEHQFLASYTEATRCTVTSKFTRFASFCATIDAVPMPAR